MTCPPKPWESGANCVNRRVGDAGVPGGSGPPDASSASAQWNGEASGSRLQSNTNIPALPSGSNLNRTTPQVPPPLPPRPDQSSSTSMYPRYGGYNSYGTSFSPYSSFSSFSSPYYGGYGGYGSYGGYGYNRFGYGSAVGPDYYGNHEANFVRVAEESSRQAFQSIESIVQAFASVSMMLESTYHAVYSSFRAVLGVADHFSRLRIHLSQILSTLAIIRTLRWLYRQLMYYLGLVKTNPSSEAAWSAAEKAATAALDEGDLKQNRSSWPIMMFFGVVLGAPWLIWRLLSSLAGSHADVAQKWPTGEADHYVAIAQYDFHGESPRELSFTVGQQVILAPKGLQPRVKGWLLASVDGKKTGLVPANYIKILGFRKRGPDTHLAQNHVAQNVSQNAAENIARQTEQLSHDTAVKELAAAFEVKEDEPSSVDEHFETQ